jgi:uncharacterized Zn finger protein (UPF0148 family)
MSEFTCPKCTAKVHASPGEVGCPSCGNGRPHRHEQIETPKTKPQVEAPPGMSGDYLTEQR